MTTFWYDNTCIKNVVHRYLRTMELRDGRRNEINKARNRSATFTHRRRELNLMKFMLWSYKARYTVSHKMKKMILHVTYVNNK